MALSKVTYVDGVTIIGAKNLNDIQDELIRQGEQQAEDEAELALKANTADVQTALALKADKSDTYTKAEVNEALGLKANTADVNSALALKADKSDTYTKEEVDSKVYPLYYTGARVNWWMLGFILAADGTLSSSNTIMVTEYISKSVKKISPLDGYKFIVAAYTSEDVYVGMWNGSSFEKSTTWLTTDVYMSNLDSSYKYRIAGAKVNGSTLVISTDGNGIIFTMVADADLELPSVSADAKATGDAISNVNEQIPVLSAIKGWIDKEFIDKTNGETKIPNGAYHRTDYIPIDADDIVLISTASGASYDRTYNAWYNADKTFISSFSYPENNKTEILSPPQGARYFRLSCNKDVDLSLEVIKGFALNTLPSRLVDLLYQTKTRNALIVGMAHNGNGTYMPMPNRNTSTTPIYAEDDLFFYTDSSHDIGWQLYDGYETGTSHLVGASTAWLKYFKIARGSYYCITLKNSNESNTDANTNNYLYCFGKMPTNEQINSVYNSLVDVENDFQQKIDKITETIESSMGSVSAEYTKGTFDAIGTITTSGNGAVSEIISNPFSIEIKANAQAVFAFYSGTTYLGKINAQGNLDKVAGSWKFFTEGVYDVTDYLSTFNADGMVYCLLPTDGTQVTTETVQTWADSHGVVASSVFATKSYVDANFVKKSGTTGANYVIGSDLLKRNVNLQQVGTLTYLQAFCIYDGSYYSIDGTHISVQDSTFTETDSASINTGHGNGLQLGNSNLAYASGWNDNKIYVVDLDTLTISDTITLPTTGYTTGVVDEVRNLAYIFQRDSYPDHEDNYNFIVYDLTNEQIVSTKKILAYGAMQAADFFNDRIIVLNGLGSVACPNGYRVFDTSGNILADYVIGDLANTEPEGVCIDRETHELFISTVGKTVYKITE